MRKVLKILIFLVIFEFIDPNFKALKDDVEKYWRWVSAGWLLRFRILAATLALLLITRYSWLYHIGVVSIPGLDPQKYHPTERRMQDLLAFLCSNFWWLGWFCTCGTLTFQQTIPQYFAPLGKVSFSATRSCHLLNIFLYCICNLFVSYLLFYQIGIGMYFVCFCFRAALASIWCVVLHQY